MSPSGDDLPGRAGCIAVVGRTSPPAVSTAPLPPRANVAVIGGGYTGLAAARALARRGTEVVVLERETIGWGASGRNGGMVLPGYKAESG